MDTKNSTPFDYQNEAMISYLRNYSRTKKFSLRLRIPPPNSALNCTFAVENLNPKTGVGTSSERAFPSFGEDEIAKNFYATPSRGDPQTILVRAATLRRIMIFSFFASTLLIFYSLHLFVFFSPALSTAILSHVYVCLNRTHLA